MSLELPMLPVLPERARASGNLRVSGGAGSEAVASVAITF